MYFNHLDSFYAFFTSYFPVNLSPFSWAEFQKFSFECARKLTFRMNYYYCSFALSFLLTITSYEILFPLNYCVLWTIATSLLLHPLKYCFLWTVVSNKLILLRHIISCELLLLLRYRIQIVLLSTYYCLLCNIICFRNYYFVWAIVSSEPILLLIIVPT